MKKKWILGVALAAVALVAGGGAAVLFRTDIKEVSTTVQAMKQAEQAEQAEQEDQGHIAYPIYAVLAEGAADATSEKVAHELMHVAMSRYRMYTGMLSSVYDAASAESISYRGEDVFSEMTAANRARNKCWLTPASCNRLKPLGQEYVGLVREYARERNRLLSLNPVAYGNPALTAQLDPLANNPGQAENLEELMLDTLEFLEHAAGLCEPLLDSGELGEETVQICLNAQHERLSRLAMLALRWERAAAQQPDLEAQLSQLPAEERLKLERATLDMVCLQYAMPEYGGSAALREWQETLSRLLPPLRIHLEQRWESGPESTVGRMTRLMVLYHALSNCLGEVTDARTAEAACEPVETMYKEVMFLRIHEREVLDMITLDSGGISGLLLLKMDLFVRTCRDRVEQGENAYGPTRLTHMMRAMHDDTLREILDCKARSGAE